MGNFRSYRRVPVAPIFRDVAGRAWRWRFKDIDDGRVCRIQFKMMYGGMGVLGILVVVLAVFGIMALFKYLM